MKPSLLVFLLLVFYAAHAQKRDFARKLRFQGSYVHEATGTEFPEKLMTFKRTSVYSFNHENTNVQVMYEDESKSNNTSVKISVYPASEYASEMRLINEYYNSVQSLAGGGFALRFRKLPVKCSGEFICNGFKAIEGSDDEINNMILMECGKWFLKIRVSSTALDSLQASELEQSILKYYTPSSFTKVAPLDTGVTIFIGSSAMLDSIFSLSVLEAAMAKAEWVRENIPSNELASGLPGTNIDMHIAAMNTQIEYLKKRKDIRKESMTKAYLDEVNAIVDAGFLEEYIAQRLHYIVYNPSGIKLDMNAYFEWLKSHQLSVLLKEAYYTIGVGEHGKK